jgi:hypothetical protein
MDNTHIYIGISFLLLGYPPQITCWVLHYASGGGGGVRRDWATRERLATRARSVDRRGGGAGREQGGRPQLSRTQDGLRRRGERGRRGWGWADWGHWWARPFSIFTSFLFYSLWFTYSFILLYPIFKLDRKPKTR